MYWKVNNALSCGLPVKGKIYKEEVGQLVCVTLKAFVCEDGDRAVGGSESLPSDHGKSGVFFFFGNVCAVFALPHSCSLTSL